MVKGVIKSQWLTSKKNTKDAITIKPKLKNKTLSAAIIAKGFL
jgi:hypothetical protein